MRKTGIRVGELADLPYHCVHQDSKTNHFLKVPLGKLDSERMVPLDDSALELIEKLQQMTKESNQQNSSALPERLILKTSGKITGRQDFMVRFHEFTYDLPI